MLDISIWD